MDISSFSRVTSTRRSSTVSVVGGVTADTLGGATSMILSANSAISSRLVSFTDEASTIRTLEGNRCMKSSRRRGPSASVAPSPSN